MTTEFASDLATVHARLSAARADLTEAVASLSDPDLERARRGGWTVRKVLEHVVTSEWLYSRLMAHLRGTTAQGDIPSCDPPSVREALAMLNASRQAILGAADGVDEDGFYRMQTAGHEEFSVLSLLENTALHDGEHAAQVREILAAT